MATPQETKSYSKEYYAKNREKILARHAKYYTANKDKLKAYGTVYNAAHKAEVGKR